MAQRRGAADIFSRRARLWLMVGVMVCMASSAMAAEAGLDIMFTLSVSNTIAVSGPWAPTLPTGTVTPGSDLVFQNNATYVQYSCKDTQHDTIRVRLSRALPTWLNLQLQVTPPAGHGSGAGWVTPSATASTVVVRSIPTNTTTGSPGGVISYKLTVSNWTAARAGAISTLGVTFSMVSN